MTTTMTTIEQRYAFAATTHQRNKDRSRARRYKTEHECDECAPTTDTTRYRPDDCKRCAMCLMATPPWAHALRCRRTLGDATVPYDEATFSTNLICPAPPTDGFTVVNRRRLPRPPPPPSSLEWPSLDELSVRDQRIIKVAQALAEKAEAEAEASIDRTRAAWSAHDAWLASITAEAREEYLEREQWNDDPYPYDPIAWETARGYRFRYIIEWTHALGSVCAAWKDACSECAPDYDAEYTTSMCAWSDIKSEIARQWDDLRLQRMERVRRHQRRQQLIDASAWPEDPARRHRKLEFIMWLAGHVIGEGHGGPVG